MDHATVLKWLEEEAKTTRIHEVTDILLEKLTEKIDLLAVVFYDMEEDPTVEDLQVNWNDLEVIILQYRIGKKFIAIDGVIFRKQCFLIL